jgi:hypothetical protein
MGKPQCWAGGRRSDGKAWLKAFFHYTGGKLLGRDVPYWVGSETQMLGFVVEEFVI